MFRNRYVKVQASYSAALPCKTLLELTVGWAAGVLARDTTFAMTGVESFLKEGGPEEEAGAMERFAGHSGQKKMRISSKIIEKKSISETTPTLSDLSPDERGCCVRRECRCQAAEFQFKQELVPQANQARREKSSHQCKQQMCTKLKQCAPS